MDIHEKLNLLGQAARFDDCVSPPSSLSSGSSLEEFGLFARPAAACPTGPDMFPYVSHVQAPGGRRVPVLKVLQTSVCQNDCLYCAFRAGRDVRRGHFTPDELAHAFDLMQRAGVVQGLFLSSGVAGTLHTMDEMLTTAELVRGKYGFRGYLHLKLLPGAEAAQIARAVELADRVSANLEAPTPDRLAALAPHKQMTELVGPLRTAAAITGRGEPSRSPWAGAPLRGSSTSPAPTTASWGHVRLGMSTQFVVGPAGESDRELLMTAQMLYREVRLARAYYSAFSPIADTPLESAAATDPRREFRLYQADWLLRYYGFTAEELAFDAGGQLSQAIDPKAAWARAHPERFPVEVNRAPLADLLRVPGIGPLSAKAIVNARRQGTLRELGDLRRLGARAEQAAPYVLLAGRRPPYQPPLPL
jgi:predicted DNA-binding helix-hairpin-helix protein